MTTCPAAGCSIAVASAACSSTVRGVKDGVIFPLHAHALGKSRRRAESEFEGSGSRTQARSHGQVSVPSTCNVHCHLNGVRCLTLLNLISFVPCRCSREGLLIQSMQEGGAAYLSGLIQVSKSTLVQHPCKTRVQSSIA